MTLQTVIEELDKHPVLGVAKNSCVAGDVVTKLIREGNYDFIIRHKFEFSVALGQ